MSRPRACLTLLPLVAVLAAACASVPVARPPFAPLPAVMADAARDPELAPLLLTVYPEPLSAQYGRELLPLDGARRVGVGDPEFLALLERRELLAPWRGLGPGGYVLEVARDGDATLVVVAAADEAGERHAASALRQLTSRTPGGERVRAAHIVDGPAFALRGSKRPQPWELAYGANFAWGARDDANHAGRELVATFAPGGTLDVSEEGLRRALDAFGPWQQRGVRRFALCFDDVGFGTTQDTRFSFGGYPRAFVVYVGVLADALRSVDPTCTVYVLPQTYWWDDPRLPSFARALRAAGGLDRGLSLVFTGPEIVSDRIDAAGLAQARATFGASERPALVYDNLGREGDWGPLTGRDPALVQVCDGVFGERGTPVHRLTRLDWSWNPEAYDAERSWRRALLELAGPRAFEELRAACAAFRAGAPRDVVAQAVDAFERAADPEWDGPLPRAELVRLLRDDLRRLGSEARVASD